MTSSNSTTGHGLDAVPGPGAADAVLRTLDTATTPGQRRDRLRAFLTEHNLTVVELARRLGLRWPSLFYNFLGGYSDTLSPGVLRRIEAVFPALHRGLAPMPEDLGRSVRCRITMQAGAYLVQADPTLPPGDQEGIVVPAGLVSPTTGLFGVRVVRASTDPTYPVGSLLVCRALLPGDTLTLPAHVIVRRALGDGVEIGVWDLYGREGSFWLARDTTGVNLEAPLPLDPPDPDDADQLVILGLVLASWQKAPPQPAP